jgi:hypothetical protein
VRDGRYPRTRKPRRNVPLEAQSEFEQTRMDLVLSVPPRFARPSRRRQLTSSARSRAS